MKSLPNKATGPSCIPSKLLHVIADLIVFPLLTCHSPKVYFLKVMPLHKGGSTQELNDFREI